MTDPEKPSKPDPSKLMSGLMDTLEGMGGVQGAATQMKEADARSKLMNLKLTLLLEAAGIDWKADPRIEALKKR
jgi:hypothetical protein